MYTFLKKEYATICTDNDCLDIEDSTEDYYLVITPQSKQVKGVVLFLTCFLSPEMLLPETKLHSAAWFS